MDPLPPDPYKVLGVEKDADLSVIKTAYKKLILKCHPDKIHDPVLAAAKQDEYHRVMQAYELLSDGGQKAKYDNRVKFAAEKAEKAERDERGDFIAFALKLFDEVRVAELARSGLRYRRHRMRRER